MEAGQLGHAVDVANNARIRTATESPAARGIGLLAPAYDRLREWSQAPRPRVCPEELHGMEGLPLKLTTEGVTAAG
jgi:hypothetical protein